MPLLCTAVLNPKLGSEMLSSVLSGPKFPLATAGADTDTDKTAACPDEGLEAFMSAGRSARALSCARCEHEMRENTLLPHTSILCNTAHQPESCSKV